MKQQAASIARTTGFALSALLVPDDLVAMTRGADKELHLHTGHFNDIGQVSSAFGWGFQPEGCSMPVICRLFAVRLPLTGGQNPILISKKSGRWTIESSGKTLVPYRGEHPAFEYENLKFYHIESVIKAGHSVPVHSYRTYDTTTRRWSSRYPKAQVGLMGFLPINQADIEETEEEADLAAKINASLWTCGFLVASAYEKEFEDQLPAGMPHVSEVPCPEKHGQALAAFASRLDNAVPKSSAEVIEDTVRGVHESIRSRRVELRAARDARIQAAGGKLQPSGKTPAPKNPKARAAGKGN